MSTHAERTTFTPAPDPGSAPLDGEASLARSARRLAFVALAARVKDDLGKDVAVAALIYGIPLGMLINTVSATIGAYIGLLVARSVPSPGAAATAVHALSLPHTAQRLLHSARLGWRTEKSGVRKDRRTAPREGEGRRPLSTSQRALSDSDPTLYCTSLSVSAR